MWHRDAYETDLKREVYGVGHADGFSEGLAEGKEEGLAEGKAHTIVTNVENLAENTNCSISEACDLLCISLEDYEKAKQQTID